jgi:Flp pilus assembly protein protease CpaA
VLWFTIELIGAAVFALILSVHDIRSLRLPNRITLVFFDWELILVTLSVGLLALLDFRMHMRVVLPLLVTHLPPTLMESMSRHRQTVKAKPKWLELLPM